MATIKSYTDIEQSKKLAEFLPLESADMYWWSSGKRYYIEAMDDGDFNEKEGDIRAWSLAALISIIPQELFGGEYIINITEGLNHKWIISYEPFSEISSYIDTSSDSLIDCCVEMIEKLHKRNLI